MVVLDASALIALINEEKGAELVEASLEDAMISTVNLAEVVGYLTDHDELDDDAKNWLGGLDIEVVSFGHKQALLAGELKRATRSKGLSLGDRACLSLAIEREAMVLTSDKAWKSLSLGVKVRLIR